MKKYDIIIFYLQICILLGTGIIFGNLVRKIKQPSILGELLGGIFIGPTVLGVFFPQLFFLLFQSSSAAATAREGVVKLGVQIFLFIIGTEMSWDFLFKSGKKVLLISFCGMLVPFLIGYTIVLCCPGLWGRQGGGDIRKTAVFIGMALSISAIPVIARILKDLKMTDSSQGRLIMASAAVDDLAGCLIFAMILRGGPSEKNISFKLFILLAALTGIFIIIRCIASNKNRCHRLSSRQSGLIGEQSAASAVFFIMLASAMFETSGLHDMFGPFLLGSLASGYFQKHKERLAPKYKLVSEVFAPLYFVSIGLKVDFISNFDPFLVAAILAAACMGKLLGAGLGGVLGGLRLREAVTVGIGLNARGAIEIIIAGSALEYGVINQRVFVALIVMAFFTSIMSAAALKSLLKTHAE